MIRQAFAAAPMFLFAAIGWFASGDLSTALAGSPEPPPSAHDAQAAEAEFIAQILGAPAADRVAAKTKAAPPTAAPISTSEWAGPEPYVLETPDVLRIKCLWPTLSMLQGNEIAGVEYSTMIGPDGTVNMQGLKPVYVAGLTIDDAEMAIEKEFSQHGGGAEITIDVLAANSKKYYVVTENPLMGDQVTACPCTGHETVLDAIAEIGGLCQQAAAKVHLCRPAPNGSGSDQILPVDWEVVRGGDTATNYALWPSDRVFVKLEPQSPASWELEVRPTSEAGCGACIAPPSAVIDAVISLSEESNEPDASAKSEPFAAPAPPAWRPSEIHREIAIHRLPAPPTAAPAPQPVPVSQIEPHADSVRYASEPAVYGLPPAPHWPPQVYPAPRPYSGPMPPAPPVMSPQPPVPVARHQMVAFAAPAPTPQIHFNISVVEDTSGSFAEFEQLRQQPRFLIGDSKTLEGTVRVLKKHRLVETISSPQLVTTVGRPAVFEVGSQMPGENEPYLGYRIELAAREITGGIVVDFGYRESKLGISTSLFIPHGHTVIMQREPVTPERAGTSAASKDQATGMVYIVLTPSLVK